MDKNKTSCKEVMSHICDNLGEDLDSPKCIAIKQHLESCDSCQQYFHSLEKTINFYKIYNAEITKESHNKLMDFLGLADCEDK